MSYEEEEQREEAKRLAWIRAALRKWPWWRKGQRLVVLDALENGNISSAYAGARALLILNGESDLDSRLLLGRTYVKAQRFKEAKTVLEKLHNDFPSDVSVTEELAAALLGLEEYDSAKELLEGVPRDHLSQSAQTARTFLERREEAS